MEHPLRGLLLPVGTSLLISLLLHHSFFLSVFVGVHWKGMLVCYLHVRIVDLARLQCNFLLKTIIMLDITQISYKQH